MSRIDREDVVNELERQIQILYKTNEVRVRKLQVKDEVKNGLHYFRESLFNAIPNVYRNMERAIDEIYKPEDGDEQKIIVPSMIRFGSWIGGDRDGNPYVKPATTEMALCLQAQAILEEYEKRILGLTQLLTQSIKLCHPSETFLKSLERDEKNVQHIFDDNPERYKQEPYRRKLHIILERIQCNLKAIESRLSGKPLKDGQCGYENENGLLQDLYLIRDSLVSHGDEIVANGELKDLIRLVETFGFFRLQKS